MVDAEHRMPLGAFVLVLAVAGVILGHGLRTQVVEGLVAAGTPREVMTVIAPDLVGGQSLVAQPQPRADRRQPPREGPVTSVRSPDEQNEVGRVPIRHAATHDRPGKAAPVPAPPAGPVAPVGTTAPAPAPVADPAPTPLPRPEPGPVLARTAPPREEQVDRGGRGDRRGHHRVRDRDDSHGFESRGRDARRHDDRGADHRGNRGSRDRSGHGR
jgi:hypothetical protein